MENKEEIEGLGFWKTDTRFKDHRNSLNKWIMTVSGPVSPATNETGCQALTEYKDDDTPVSAAVFGLMAVLCLIALG